MSEQIKALDIPVKVVGPGSQTNEEEAELQYMTMPKNMDTFTAPIILDDNLESYPAAKEKLAELGEYLRVAESLLDEPASINISEVPADNIDFLNKFLGEGEVAAKVIRPNFRFENQETVLAGVWRVAEFAGDKRLDYIEIGAVPRCVMHETFVQAKTQMEIPSTFADGVINAPAVLAEINSKIAEPLGEHAHVINLSLLPQTPEDLECLNEVMGVGSTVVLSRGYGICRITSTQTKNTWWVQYFNSEDKLILNTIEITDIPVAAKASIEDLGDSNERLIEMVESVSL